MMDAISSNTPVKEYEEHGYKISFFTNKSEPEGAEGREWTLVSYDGKYSMLSQTGSAVAESSIHS